MFKIEDELHAEPQAGQFDTFDAAIAELRRRAELPWNESPNIAPCASWQTCGRNYEIVEYDDSSRPWLELSRTLALQVSCEGARWLTGDPTAGDSR
jgi:hypothetical protein